MKTFFFSIFSFKGARRNFSLVVPSILMFIVLFSACGSGGDAKKEGALPGAGEWTDQYIIEHYYPKAFEVSTHMGEADDYQKALSLYNEGKYPEAISIMEKLPLDKADGQMALANAYMQSKQYDKAIPLLKKASEDVNFSNEAKQNLIVSYILAKQIQFAKIDLESYLKSTSLTPKDTDWANGLMADLNAKAAKAKP
jgi:tetratricopeptide (TPR) repeat protein